MKRIVSIDVESAGKVGAVFGFGFGALGGIVALFYIAMEATDGGSRLGAVDWVGTAMALFATLVCIPLIGAAYGGFGSYVCARMYNRTVGSHGGLKIALE